MGIKIKSKSGLRCFYNRNTFLAISFLSITVLVFSCFVSVFSAGGSFFVSGAPDKVVSNEAELRNTISGAVGPIVVALDNDITLTRTLVISANKHITLTSANISGFFKLIGAAGQNTIVIENRGALTLDGIIVTHANGVDGRGVFVSSGSILIMSSGVITNNVGVGDIYTVYGNGGGVCNFGTFEMTGGKIYNNTGVNGGGVFTTYDGVFSMSGGEIYSNTVTYNGGGVSIANGTFNMSDGEIYNNLSPSGGGGVIASHGSNFAMSGGKIFGNTATTIAGGVLVDSDSGFTMSGGTISNNTATANA